MATNANIVVSSVVHLVPGAASAPSEEEIVLNTTINNYATDTAAYATQIVNYINGTGGTLKEINATVRIANVTAPTPDYQQQLAGQPVAEEEWSFLIGPSDYTTATDLQNVYNSNIAKARSFTSY